MGDGKEPISQYPEVRARLTEGDGARCGGDTTAARYCEPGSQRGAGKICEIRADKRKWQKSTESDAVPEGVISEKASSPKEERLCAKQVQERVRTGRAGRRSVAKVGRAKGRRRWKQGKGGAQLNKDVTKRYERETGPKTIKSTRRQKNGDKDKSGIGYGRQEGQGECGAGEKVGQAKNGL